MQKHILLVDSDAESLDRLSRTLRLHDYRVSEARDGADGLALVDSLRPDCIIFDVDLPRVSGTIMYSRLRRSEKTRQLPAIVCSDAGPRPVDFGTGIPVLSKNCAPEALLEAVRAATA